MSQCEDFPCCGHGPPPLGDGGGCPDAEGRFNCVLCGTKLPKRATSSICKKCRRNPPPYQDEETGEIVYPEDQ